MEECEGGGADGDEKGRAIVRGGFGEEVHWPGNGDVAQVSSGGWIGEGE